MRISVLTVAWNASATISHAIESFLTQTHPDKELIVIDGASPDGTAEIARAYPGPITVVSEPDRGMYDALNKGLDLYTGDVFGVLNADDAFHDPTVLSRIADALRNADMAHGHLNFVEDHQGKQIRRRWRAEDRPQRGFRAGWAPAHPTFYARRHVAEAVGRFDTGLSISSDYDWLLRAIELHDFRLARIDAVLIDMMEGGMSTRSLAAHLRHNLQSLAARRRWLGAGPVDYALFAKPLRKIGQFF